MDEQRSVISAAAAEGPLMLAIDIGTSAVKILLFDRLGRAVEDIQWRQTVEIRSSADGASEVDPDRLLEIVWQGIDAVVAKAGRLASEIAGVAICTFVGNIMGINQKGRPVTALLTYADTRAEAEAAGLRAELDETAVRDRTGCHFHSSYLPARLRWLAKARPDVVGRVARWISIGEFLELKLFGETTVSYSVASWSGLLDRHRLNWDEPLLTVLPLEITRLSPLADIDSPKQGLLSDFAARWKELGSIPWFPAIGDGAAANIGSGCISACRVALTMGSSTAVRTVVDRTIHHIPKGLWCYRVDGRRSLPGGAMNEGGSFFAWMKNTFQLGDLSQLEPALKAMPPDGNGLTILPFLAGERSPGWQGHAKATIHGLSLATAPLQILQAGMEAVAYRLCLVFEKLTELLPEEYEVIASGGAIQNSPVWLQIITDVLGRPTGLSSIRESSARGAALLAFEALGLIEDLKKTPVFLKRTYYPDSERYAIYRSARERQKRLYQKLIKDDGYSAEKQ